MEITEPSSTITPFNHFGACADEAVVFDDGRVRLQWLQNTTDTHAARKVNVFTDLRTGANGGPGINHGAFINVCANVHIGWHQHGVTGDKCTLANRRRWHHTETFFLETRFVRNQRISLALYRSSGFPHRR
ncbi:Uncharacterised protein [Leclercia adecarboxylata]|uniref:Uncharacterized protein n=1 Tax=Leclercia adecarboxylata TaxID=83655 RepID=A0A4U9HP65_9ENTR|nr:Uncharacterised protein [Leclercia adecarboxylata]